MHNVKKTGNSRFFMGMLIYAVVFLAVLAAGLAIFWDYMKAYENSRPLVTVNDYMQNLTEEHICDLARDFIGQIDQNIQTQAQSRAYIMDAIDGVTYAKKTKECTEKRQVFVLRTGTTVIGEFSIVAEEDGKYGFTPWHLEQESIDLSGLNLFGAPCQVTVPSDHTVTVNGYVLNDAYITDDKIPYEPIADYYENYDLPHRVTYSVSPVFGEMDVVITDPAGNQVTFGDNTDWTPYFHNCTKEERAALDVFTENFVGQYVAFTGSNRNSRYVYYNRLKIHVVQDSDFARRLWEAIEGLEFGQSMSDKIVSITTHHQVRLEEGRYLCDITYEVDTTGNKGVVRTAINAKLMVIQTEDGLKVEAMSVY